MSRPAAQTRPDLYARVTDSIIADLERGVRPWTRPWSAEHLAGRITRPLRHNLQPYSGINVVLLWSEAVARGFTAPIWMTFRQALELAVRGPRELMDALDIEPTAPGFEVFVGS